ncbi:MAG: DUF3137 domain-containing protein [Campylobacterales bacterium]|nr:DUF3137 domain-containing protein [Campylobacterales bacterium]
MKSTSELTDFYYKTLYPDLKTIEEERLRLKSKLTTTFAFIGLIAAIVMYGIYDATGTLNDGIFIIGFIAVAIGGVVYKMTVRDYTQTFKQKVIRPLVRAIDEQLSYQPEGMVGQMRFERSGLFRRSIDRYGGNDYVRGEIDGVPIEFSDLHAQYQTKDSKGNTHWHTIFQGLFIVSEFNKHFKGTTYVLPDSAQKSFGTLIGQWLQSTTGSHGELVKMDDPEFEKHFVVYASDQIEARYILTPSLMERLNRIRKRSKAELYIAFVSSHLYLGISTKRDLFEPSVFQSLLRLEQAMEYIGYLHLAIGMVEELKLNQKLWSKS